ncbi:hypothetical protein AAG906_017252 [Vitis piasezkii]
MRGTNIGAVVGKFLSFHLIHHRQRWPHLPSQSSGRGRKMILNGVKPSKKTLASEKQLKALLQETERLREENVVLRIQASTSGPPRRQRSRGQVANSRPEPESIYPGSAGAIPGAYNVRPHEPHTPMPRAPREESSDSTHFSAKRQRDKKSQLSSSMRARLGPQEPGRSRPPVATTWAPRPDPIITPMKPPKRATHWLHQQKAGRHALHTLLLPYHPLRAPKGIPRTKIFHIRWNQRSLRSHHALSTAHDARYWQRCTAMQSIPRQSTRAGPLMLCGQYLCSADTSVISSTANIKMRDNESLREFVKRFGQAVLQIEACSMDAVLQIFKRSICPSTPFFESLAKKPPTTMDDLFRRANKYSMLEDDVRAATQQVLVAGRASRDDADRHAKPPDRPKPVDRRQEGPSRPDRPPHTPLHII